MEHKAKRTAEDADYRAAEEAKAALDAQKEKVGGAQWHGARKCKQGQLGGQVSRTALYLECTCLPLAPLLLPPR